MTKEEIIARWDKVLGEIEGRFTEILSQAVEESENFISQLKYTTSGLDQAWSGISAELRKLEKKADTIWTGNMEDLYGRRDDVSSEERLEQYYKRTNLNVKMENALHRAKTKVFADAGRKIYQNVMDVLNEEKIYNCTQCSAPLDIPFFSFVAKNIKCDACGTVNSYEPDSRMTALEHTYLTAISEELVQEEWCRINELENELWKCDKRESPEKYTQLEEEKAELERKKITISHDFLRESIKDKEEYYRARKETQLPHIHF